MDIPAGKQSALPQHHLQGRAMPTIERIVATTGWHRKYVFSKGARGVTYRERQLSGEWTVCLMRWGLLALVLLVALVEPIEPVSVLRRRV